jgi:PhzF family phenazine biosynthesis protein
VIVKSTYDQHSRAGGEPRKRTQLDSSSSTTTCWVYSCFADDIGGGNPAGVVLTAAPLADQAAQAIAAVLSLPTTGFVVPSAERGVADVRFFTPEQEIDACGHVTIAVATALVERGIWHWGDDVVVRAAGGEFALGLRDGLVAMTQRLAFIEPAPPSWPEVRAGLGALGAHPSLPLVCAGTGLRHLIIPVADPAQLNRLELDARRIAALAHQAGVDTVCVFSPIERGRARVRDLCAAIGSLEEAASGTTAATLALFLHLADGDWLLDYKLLVEQGVEMGRPSRLEVNVIARDAAIVRGRARKLLAGTLAPWSDDERS